MRPLSMESPTAPWALKCRNFALIAICVVVIELCFVAGMTQLPPRVNFFGTVALGWSFVTFCVFDARVHGRHFEHGFVIPMLATYPVAIVVHLVWTRGVHKGLIVYTVAVTTAVVVGVAAWLAGRALAG
jgi:hypothetical protein